MRRITASVAMPVLVGVCAGIGGCDGPDTVESVWGPVLADVRSQLSDPWSAEFFSMKATRNNDTIHYTGCFRARNSFNGYVVHGFSATANVYNRQVSKALVGGWSC